jgi:radical SAM superfamily enzyme YgiQ (UPF0313 family)
MGCGIFPLSHPDEEKMYERVKELAGRGMRAIYFGDDEADHDMLSRFAERIQRDGLKLLWTVNTRFSSKIDMEWAMNLRRGGCLGLAFGLETFEDRLLSLIQKGTTRAMIEECVGNLAWGGVSVLAYMIVGLPTETEAEARASFERLVGHVESGEICNVVYSPYTVAYKSPIYEHPERYGVTRLLPNPGQDLAPNIDDFEHSGMSRQKALELYGEFNAVLMKLKANLKNKRTAPTLS